MQLQLPPSVLLLLSLVAFNCKLVTPNVVLHNHVSKENIHNRSQIKGCKSPIQHYNLFGIPGDGYYVAAQIGTPPQNVSTYIAIFVTLILQMNSFYQLPARVCYIFITYNL